MKLWPAPLVLDQGYTQDCGGFGWAGALLAMPKALTVTRKEGNKLGHDLYMAAVESKGFTEKWMLENKYIDAFRYILSVDRLQRSVIHTGPVVVSMPWYDGFSNATSRMRATGDVSYHCVFIRGFDPLHRFGFRRRPAFMIRNSWGKDWGIGGDSWISASVLDRVLKDGGPDYGTRAVVPIDRLKDPTV